MRNGWITPEWIILLRLLAVRLAVFTLGWTLMIIAMMLPGTLLLLDRCLENTPFSSGAWRG